MRRAAFLDTSAIFAIADSDDDCHAIILAAYANQPLFITHSAILLETFSLIAKRINKSTALDVLDKFRASPRIEIVSVNADLQEAGWARCLKFADKEWDWIDCVSFELMERRGIRSALTLDRHFRQAGFVLLC